MSDQGKVTWDGVDRIDWGPEPELTPEQLKAILTPEYLAAIERLHICKTDEGLGMRAEDVQPGKMTEVKNKIAYVPWSPNETTNT